MSPDRANSDKESPSPGVPEEHEGVNSRPVTLDMPIMEPGITPGGQCSPTESDVFFANGSTKVNINNNGANEATWIGKSIHLEGLLDVQKQWVADVEVQQKSFGVFHCCRFRKAKKTLR